MWKFAVWLSCALSCLAGQAEENSEQKEMRAAEKIFFLHLPKSGGVTFRSVISDRYPQDASTRMLFPHISLDDIVSVFRDHTLVHGHLLYFRVKQETAGFKKVTVMREPVARVISEQKYISKRFPPEKTKQILKEHFLPLEGEPIDTAANVACRFFSALDPMDAAIPIEKHLESAKQTLSHEFDFIGITEKMEESLQLFYEQMGWRVPEWTPVHNTTFSEEVYSPEVLDGIAKRNWADIELYRHALALYEAQKTRIQHRSKEEVVEWVSQVDFNFEGALDGWGWCPREQLPEGTFRWLCSPEKGTIAFPLKAGSDYRLKTRIYILPHLLSRLCIKVNGHPLRYSAQLESTATDKKKYSWVDVEAAIPRRWIVDQRKTQIEITINDPKRPPMIDAYRGRCGSNRLQLIPAS